MNMNWRQEDASIWEGDVFIGRANTAFQAKHIIDAHNSMLQDNHAYLAGKSCGLSLGMKRATERCPNCHSTNEDDEHCGGAWHTREGL